MTKNRLLAPTEIPTIALLRYMGGCLLIAILLVSAACHSDRGEKIAYNRLREVAGRTAKDCGLVPTVGIRSANQCALEAFAGKMPFLIRYRIQGLDSELVVGLASKGSDGNITSIKYDSDGWDARGLPPEVEVIDEGHVLKRECRNVTALSVDERGVLSCPDLAKGSAGVSSPRTDGAARNSNK